MQPFARSNANAACAFGTSKAAAAPSRLPISLSVEEFSGCRSRANKQGWRRLPCDGFRLIALTKGADDPDRNGNQANTAPERRRSGAQAGNRYPTPNTTIPVETTAATAFSIGIQSAVHRFGLKSSICNNWLAASRSLSAWVTRMSSAFRTDRRFKSNIAPHERRFRGERLFKNPRLPPTRSLLGKRNAAVPDCNLEIALGSETLVDEAATPCGHRATALRVLRQNVYNRTIRLSRAR